MAVLVLSHADVAQLLPMRDCVDVMADALTALSRGDALLPLRQVRGPRYAVRGTPSGCSSPRTSHHAPQAYSSAMKGYL